MNPERLLPKIEPPIQEEEIDEDGTVEREVNGIKYKILNCQRDLWAEWLKTRQNKWQGSKEE